jgi:cytochrome c-type biogenesis protein CcmH
VIGFVMLAAVGLAAFAGLYALRLRGALLQLAGAALLIGGAGYALQGRPALPGASAPQAVDRMALPTAALRKAFFGEFSGAERWLIIADSYTRRGDTGRAVGILRSAVREHPRSPELWIGLGNALVDHAGELTPASQLAYSRALELAPGHPAPRYFLGLALVRSGDPRSAAGLWHSILVDAPADASWRPIIEDSLAALRPRARTS